MANPEHFGLQLHVVGTNVQRMTQADLAIPRPMSDLALNVHATKITMQTCLGALTLGNLSASESLTMVMDHMLLSSGKEYKLF